VLLGAFFVQFAATLAIAAFHDIGPAATSAWRFFFGAVVLIVVVRPRVRSWTRRQWVAAATLGVATAFMNQCFYQSIARIHLGSAVAIEYLGPFLVAAFGRPSWRRGLYVAAAALGVVALTRPGSGITVDGALFAAGAGCGWAAYTLAQHRVGGATEGFEGLAVAMAIAAVVTFAVAAPTTLVVWTTPHLLVRLVTMATLAIVLGFGVELQALRRLRPSEVGVLLALNPAVAFLVGWIFLHQAVSLWDLVGVLLVVGAGMAVTRSAEVIAPIAS
jgi:inner membrane transporter RhtA